MSPTQITNKVEAAQIAEACRVVTLAKKGKQVNPKGVMWLSLLYFVSQNYSMTEKDMEVIDCLIKEKRYI